MGYKTKSMLHIKGKGAISNYYTKVDDKLKKLEAISKKENVKKYSDANTPSNKSVSSRSKINPGTGARLGGVASDVFDFFSKKEPVTNNTTESGVTGESLVSDNENSSSAEATEASSLGSRTSGFEGGLGVKLSEESLKDPTKITDNMMMNPKNLPTLGDGFPMKSDAFSKGMERKKKRKGSSNTKQTQKPEANNSGQTMSGGSMDQSIALRKFQAKYGNVESELLKQGGKYKYIPK